MKKITAFFILFIYIGSLSAQPTAKMQDQELPLTSIISAQKEGSKTLLPSAQLAMSTLDYPVTAGDVYGLAFAVGSNPVTYTISVDTSYRVRVANLAVLNARGKTFYQLKQEVEEIVTKNYPLSGVQFILISPGIFKVSIKGEVSVVNEKQTWALIRLSQIIADTFTEYSSKRNITVTAADGSSKTYDIFKAERFGDLKQNPYMRPGDIVSIGRIERMVSISGGIERADKYELLSGEGLKELIDYYGGGLAPFADINRIELTHTLGGKQEYLSKTDYDNNYQVQHYDKVFIDSLLNTQPVVYIEGIEGIVKNEETAKNYDKVNVNQTGLMSKVETNRIALPFFEGTDWSYIVRQNRSLFSASSDTANAYILRGKETISINIDRILYDPDYKSPVSAKAYDVLSVPSRKMLVTVGGAVNSPGRYTYVPNRTYEYYVGLAGGYVASNTTEKQVLLKDIYGKKLRLSDPIMPETIITIKNNGFILFWNQYAPVLVTILGIISTSLTIWALSRGK